MTRKAGNTIHKKSKMPSVNWETSRNGLSWGYIGLQMEASYYNIINRVYIEDIIGNKETYYLPSLCW